MGERCCSGGACLPSSGGWLVALVRRVPCRRCFDDAVASPSGRVWVVRGAGRDFAALLFAMRRSRDIVVAHALACLSALAFVCGGVGTSRSVVSRVGGSCGAYSGPPTQRGDFGLEFDSLDVSGLELRSYHALVTSVF